MAGMTSTGNRPTWAEWRLVVALSALIVAVALVPYLLAYGVDDGHTFGGFLINPGDGNSYFAKMRQGLRGEWLFTLPYTAEPGPGAFIFVYYLFLGHVAKWTGASVDGVYHAARTLGGLAALLAGYAVIARFFEARRPRIGVWLLWALGSGFGWLAAPLGAFTADLWVSEAIPFLTVYSNAHFGLTTALLLLLILWTAPGLAAPDTSLRKLALVAAGTTLLAQVQPMALLNVGLVLAGVFAWRWLACRPSRGVWRAWVREWAAAAVFGLCAAPWVAHAALLTATHPVLAEWNKQNVTPTPPVWDTALSGGALLLLAVPGAVGAARRRSPREMVAFIWLGLGALALYAPFALQRRLSIGLWLPLAVLAGLGLREVAWPHVRPRHRPFFAGVLAVTVGMSNLLVYAGTLGAIAARDAKIFFGSGQAAALAWMAANAGRSVVAAPPEMGLLIPAHTDARVIYGHPFETVQAEAREAQLEAFYAGQVSGPAFVVDHDVRYVVAEPGSDSSWTRPTDWDWPVVFEQGGLIIYAP